MRKSPHPTYCGRVPLWDGKKCGFEGRSWSKDPKTGEFVYRDADGNVIDTYFADGKEGA
jgi:hypothetical protein